VDVDDGVRCADVVGGCSHVAINMRDDAADDGEKSSVVDDVEDDEDGEDDEDDEDGENGEDGNNSSDRSMRTIFGGDAIFFLF